MKLDIVHDIQNAYVNVIKSMSMPGEITSIKAESEKVDVETGCRKNTFIMMLMLLDREVTFNIVSKNREEVSKIVSQMTYSKENNIDEADYIFILEDAIEEDLVEVINKAKIGDLINPNKSATIISEVNLINNKEEKLILKGPGIETSSFINISGNKKWIRERNIKNEEYPLGVDLIFIDKDSKVVCLPRTTQIIQKEADN